MEYNKANILILFAIISSVAADSSSIEDIKRTVLDSPSVCPPFGKKAKFEVETIQTKSLMYGCAYMGNESLLSTAPLFHLWLERPEQSFGHGHCDNTQNMDHFMFECLSKHDRPTNKDESEMGWQYISLLEHTAESMQSKTKTRTHRCALYDVHDEDDRKIRIIRMVISKPVIGEEFNVSQCNGLSDLLARNLLPYLPEGYRYWPDGSLYIYLLGRKAKIFYTTKKYPDFPVTSRPTTTTSRPSISTTTTSRPSTTTTTTSHPSTTTTTTANTYPSIDYSDRVKYLFSMIYIP
ncbi:uncharacterized protein LOC132953623 [Metopolophium dirhodum]|uniref:uncharacterized protein LOC132953623 n=1 Tax=Metopolophium dirhodum TaxID=44670 RepID=UPI00298F5D40|nr:uncharacterized protein LOC132953623 [Metopolophium dirhodum]